MDKLSRHEGVMSALGKMICFYALEKIEMYKRLASRCRLYVSSSTLINEDEKKYLNNFISSFEFLNAKTRGEKFEGLFDDSYDKNNVSSLFFENFPYSKDKNKLFKIAVSLSSNSSDESGDSGGETLKK